MSLFIQDAIAASEAIPATAASPMSSIIMLVGFILIFYFLLLRPQNKRAKQHRELITQLAKGDEVVTNGGVLGKINKIKDDFIVLSVADEIEITIQKSAVANTLPKGTLKSI